MKTLDLQEEFINALNTKFSKRADLENRIADVLMIEKDAAYRRLTGKVNFSIREMGILAKEFGLSIDRLLRNDMEYLWIPFILEYPMKQRSMDSLCDIVDLNLSRLKTITQDYTKSGNVYTSLPMEFYMFFPTLTKFMFFKWGHYFVGTDEFNDFSSWKLPRRLTGLKEMITTSCQLDSVFYIWDVNLIWGLVMEIDSFYRMHILAEKEKNIIKQELKILSMNLERFLNGNWVPNTPFVPEIDFYVSTINMGFTSNYYASEKINMVSFHTHFSFAAIDDCYDSFEKMKNWIDSLRNVSTLLSKSGRIERRLFFETQNKIIEQL